MNRLFLLSIVWYSKEEYGIRKRGMKDAEYYISRNASLR